MNKMQVHPRFGVGRVASEPRRLRFPLTLLIAGLLALLLAACSSDAMMGLYLEANQDKLGQPLDPKGRPMQFVVQPGTPARTIAENLAGAGLIADARLLEAYVRANGLAAQLEAGVYTLSPSYTPVEIVEILQHARAPGTVVSIPEGWRLEQTADYLEKNGILDGAVYRWIAALGDVRDLPNGADGRYAFLAERPAGASLEGYLFPETYELPTENITPTDLLARQLAEFARQIVPEYQAVVVAGNTTLSLHQTLTLASIVEREAVLDEERPVIAGVYLNRLAIDMRLEADPTVQYAMGYQPETGQWWKTPVFLEEYGAVDSPYNTYLHEGLPPGPIASPGLSSVQAVLTPAQHDYIYFVATPDGSGRHVFATTFSEHEENVRRYRGE